MGAGGSGGRERHLMTWSVSGHGAGAQGLEEAEAGPVATLSSQGCAWGLLRALATVFILIKMNLSLRVPGADLWYWGTWRLLGKYKVHSPLAFGRPFSPSLLSNPLGIYCCASL